MATRKRFRLAASEIRRLIPNHGGCIASDRITVDGARVAYMVRQEPTRREDSGWVFTAGTETQAYMDNADNFEVYDCNTIANYDPDIIPFLGAPVGSAFERANNTGPLVPCDGTMFDPDAPPNWPPPGFPVVDGVHALTKSWSITLPARFARRIEDGSLVLWRPGITLWISAFHNDRGESQQARLAGMKKAMSADATDVREVNARGLTRLTYRLIEDDVHSLTVLVLADTGHLQLAIYFDEEGDAATAHALADSIALRAPE